ncbi:hypothetical protein, partial [Streptomyces rhizosphaericus]|uniref:hypothetical protein n=1 Tax=Streptomyces rhizosphaericus TaxID=114699 RepID=UPI0031D95328
MLLAESVEFLALGRTCFLKGGRFLEQRGVPLVPSWVRVSTDDGHTQAIHDELAAVLADDAADQCSHLSVTNIAAHRGCADPGDGRAHNGFCRRLGSLSRGQPVGCQSMDDAREGRTAATVALGLVGVLLVSGLIEG